MTGNTAFLAYDCFVPFYISPVHADLHGYPTLSVCVAKGDQDGRMRVGVQFFLQQPSIPMKNRSMCFTGLIRIAGLFLVLPLLSSATMAQRSPVIIPGKDTLPLRVLTRPFSSVYETAQEDAALVEENLPAFQPLYVYTAPQVDDFDGQTGWYEVGSDDKGTVLGWMRAEDVMEWKQAMCLAYTHPEGRQPVLMFGKRDSLFDLLQASDRAEQAESLLNTATSGEIPDDFPLISMEPKRAVFMFIEEQFYLLPILSHEPIELDGREGRLLQLAAATTAKGGRGKTTLEDKAFVESAAIASTESKSVQDLKIELVYVIDTTASMQPFIEGTLRAIEKMAGSIAGDPDIADNVRFGMWAFRDSLEIEGIEYLTKNYTPELQDATAFAATLGSVAEAKVGSKGFPEDVFSGLDKAIAETAWSEDAMRFIVLIGDAPSHTKGEAWNASGKGSEEISQLAKDKGIYVFSGHLRDFSDPRKEEFFDLTEQQFRKVSENRDYASTGREAYYSLPADDPAAFDAMSDTLLNAMRDLLSAARKQGSVEEVVAFTAADDFDTSGSSEEEVTVEQVETEVAGLANQMIKAALVDWIGKKDAVQAPRDITAWVVDKDLADPMVPSLEVRVLINKNELDSLRTVLQELMLAGRQGQMSGTGFFDALQATSATLSVTPEQIANARTLSDTGLIPEFLQDLPYKSRIMGMTSEDWNNWSQDQQDEFLNDLDAKISYYAAVHDDPGVWVRLNMGDDPDAYVHPMSLEMLP